MPTPAVVLEVIGQAVLPALGDLSGPLPSDRVAREVWHVWGRERDLAGRRDDLTALLGLAPAEQARLVGDVARRLLPDRGTALSALTRYLASLPGLLRRLPDLGIPALEDLLRWLPPRLPQFQPGDRPAGVGDRELFEPVRIDLHAECWLARNPLLPERPPVLLVFLTEAKPPEPLLGWHRGLSAGGCLALEHTFLTAQPPVLQFASPPDDTIAALARDVGPTPVARVWRRIVAVVATLHQRTPIVTLGRLEPADIYLSRDGDVYNPCLFLTEPPAVNDPRNDVLLLGRVGQLMHQVGGGQEERLAVLIAACLSADPLHRPADAVDLLARLDAIVTPARQPTPPRAEGRVSRLASRNPFDQVQNVLASLEKGEPKLAKRFSNSVGMTFVLLQNATIQMGSPPGEIGRREQEGPVHEVVLTRPFYLAIHPVTQRQYEAVAGVNPSRFRGAAGGGPDHPVEMVSWDDAVAFCRKLSELPAEKSTGRSYRLPSEAEWEYACRAGTSTPFSTGDSLASTQAAFDGNYPYGAAVRGPAVPRTQQVGSFAANHFGLFDLHGNVWEWCSDWYDAGYYAHSPRQDPPGPPEGEYRVLRGGSWRNQAVICRSAYRNALAPNQRQPFIGFRVVAVLTPTSES